MCMGKAPKANRAQIDAQQNASNIANWQRQQDQQAAERMDNERRAQQDAANAAQVDATNRLNESQARANEIQAAAEATMAETRKKQADAAAAVTQGEADKASEAERFGSARKRGRASTVLTDPANENSTLGGSIARPAARALLG